MFDLSTLHMCLQKANRCTAVFVALLAHCPPGLLCLARPGSRLQCPPGFVSVFFARSPPPPAWLFAPTALIHMLLLPLVFLLPSFSDCGMSRASTAAGVRRSLGGQSHTQVLAQLSLPPRQVRPLRLVSFFRYCPLTSHIARLFFFCYPSSLASFLFVCSSVEFSCCVSFSFRLSSVASTRLSCGSFSLPPCYSLISAYSCFACFPLLLPVFASLYLYFPFCLSRSVFTALPLVPVPSVLPVPPRIFAYLYCTVQVSRAGRRVAAWTNVIWVPLPGADLNYWQHQKKTTHLLRYIAYHCI